MNIRDEIDAMLDNLKTGGSKPASSTDAPKKKTAPTVHKPARSVYDSMSVDDLLSALTEEPQKSPAPTKTSTAPVTQPEKSNIQEPVKTTASRRSVQSQPVARTSQPRTTTAAKTSTSKTSGSGIPQNLLDIMSGGGSNVATMTETAALAPTTEADEPIAPSVNRKSSVQKIKESLSLSAEAAAKESEKPAVEDTAPETEKAKEPLPVSQPEEDFIAPEPEEAPLDKDVSEETEDENVVVSDDVETETEFEADEDEAEEKAPKKVKRGLFSGIKSLFSKKKADDEDYGESAVEDYEEADESFDKEATYDSNEEEEAAPEEESEAISESFEEITEELSVPEAAPTEEAFADDTAEELVKDDATEKIAPEANNIDEANETEEEHSLDSATELVEAALAAIEELNLETDNTDESSSDESEEDPTDELISDIREDAAIAIAEITSDNTDSAKEAEPAPAETEEALSDEKISKETEENINIDVNVEAPKKKGRIVTALERILEENPDVISDERSEKTEADEIDVSVEKKGSGKLKRRLYTVLGVFFAVFTVIGLIASIKFGMNRFRSFTAGENKKDSFTDIIYPAVIMDIESFATPTELSSEQVVSAALWSLVMSEEKMSKYEATFDIISVPAVDAEAYAAELFGDKLPEITHTTVGSGELKFYYNEATKSYNVPVNPITFTYEPVITSVSKTDSEYTLVVDYIKELPAWIEDKEGHTSEVSKTVEFKLTEKDGAYTISSMTLLNVNAAV